jgi:L-fucose isomerase-like protein
LGHSKIAVGCVFEALLKDQGRCQLISAVQELRAALSMMFLNLDIIE